MTTYTSVANTIVTDLTEAIEGGAKSKNAIVKALKEILKANEKRMAKVFTAKGDKPKAKRAPNWTSLWASKEWGAMRFFSKKYASVKEEIGSNHFTIISKIRDWAETEGKWDSWWQKVQKEYEEAPTKPPGARKEKVVATAKDDKTEGPDEDKEDDKAERSDDEL